MKTLLISSFQIILEDKSGWNLTFPDKQKFSDKQNLEFVTQQVSVNNQKKFK